MGINLWVGTWERDPHWIDSGFDHADWPPDAFRSKGEEQRLKLALRDRQDRTFLNVAIDRMVTDPLSVVSSWVVRYPYLWLGTRTEQIQLRPERGTIVWTTEKAAFYLLNIATLIAGFAGMVMAIRNDRRWIIAAMPIAYIAILYIPFHNTEPRYSLPAIPFLLAFAAYAATRVMLSFGYPRHNA